MWRNLAIIVSKQLLAHSVITRQAANNLAGKTLQLNIAELAKPLNLAFHQDYVALPTQPHRLDLKISASLADLAALAKAEDVQLELAQRSIRIEGDTAMLFALQKLLATPDISLSALLVPVVGFNGAQAIEVAAQGFLALLSASISSQYRQSQEWLVWESDWVVSRNEFAVVTQALHNLQTEVAALAQRIGKLEK